MTVLENSIYADDDERVAAVVSPPSEPVDMLGPAQGYAARGWPIVPLHTPNADGICDCPKHGDCPKPGKHPRTKNGFKDASTEATVITRWWKMWPHANIGLDLHGAGLVDIAPDSEHWLAEFKKRGLPRTMCYASGSGPGHEHYLYRRPDGCPVLRICRSNEYDLLSDGYAVLPPSLHPKLRRYTWLVEPDNI